MIQELHEATQKIASAKIKMETEMLKVISKRFDKSSIERMPCYSAVCEPVTCNFYEIKAVNSAFAQRLGYEPKELLGKNIFDLMSERSRSMATYVKDSNEGGLYNVLFKAKNKVDVALTWFFEKKKNQSELVLNLIENDVVATK